MLMLSCNGGITPERTMTHARARSTVHRDQEDRIPKAHRTAVVQLWYDTRTYHDPRQCQVDGAGCGRLEDREASLGSTGGRHTGKGIQWWC